MTEEQLIQAYYDGSDEAFEELERRLRGYLRFRTLGAPKDGDAVQKVLMKMALTKGTPSEFRPGRGSFHGWVGAMAQRVVADCWRKHRPTDDLTEVVDPSPWLDGLVAHREEVQAALDCLEDLEWPYSAVMRRRLAEETFADIADSMGEKLNWAVEKERTARRRLRGCMEGKGYGRP